MWPGFSCISPIGTWCERQEPSARLPSITFGQVQPLGERRTIIGQRGRSATPFFARGLLNAPNLVECPSSAAAISWCIFAGSWPSTKYRRVAVAAEQLIQFLVADAREHAGIGNFVAVQMQDRQHRAVGGGIEELVRVPARRQRAGLRFAVADDGSHDQIGIVKGRAERVAQARSPVRRPRESSRAFPARRDWECRPGRRIV